MSLFTKIYPVFSFITIKMNLLGQWDGDNGWKITRKLKKLLGPICNWMTRYPHCIQYG